MRRRQGKLTFKHIYVCWDKIFYLILLLVHFDQSLIGSGDDGFLSLENKREPVPLTILLDLLTMNFQPNMTVLGWLNVDKCCPPATF